MSNDINSTRSCCICMCSAVHTNDHTICTFTGDATVLGKISALAGADKSDMTRYVRYTRYSCLISDIA
jgi:hypothetical protein